MGCWICPGDGIGIHTGLRSRVLRVQVSPRAPYIKTHCPTQGVADSGWKDRLVTNYWKLSVSPDASKRWLQCVSIYAPVDKFGKVASLKQRSIICRFESDRGYQLRRVMQRGWSCDRLWIPGSQKWDGVRLLCSPPIKDKCKHELVESTKFMLAIAQCIEHYRLR